MNKEEKKKCKEAFIKEDKSYNYESYKAGFNACLNDKKFSLPNDFTINKFMAISNIYAMTHPDGWSIRELREFIKDKWPNIN